MSQLVTACPVCGGPFHVDRLGCDRCRSALEGHFELGWLGRLTREQLEFVEILVKNRGNINGVATELKIAYNTARSRLDDIVMALGYTVPQIDRRDVLQRVDDGEISVDDALRLLRGEE
jgi:hypothetical protein